MCRNFETIHAHGGVRAKGRGNDHAKAAAKEKHRQPIVVARFDVPTSSEGKASLGASKRRICDATSKVSDASVPGPANINTPFKCTSTECSPRTNSKILLLFRQMGIQAAKDYLPGTEDLPLSSTKQIKYHASERP